MVRDWKELKTMGQVIPSHTWEKMTKNEQDELKSQKALLMPAGHGYAHKKYKVLSNPAGLNDEELALIADNGNLPFGYRTQDGLIIVHTD